MRARRSNRAGSALALALAPAVAALMLGSHASAGSPADPPIGHLVFARDGALWRVPVVGEAEPTRLAALPDGEPELRTITSSANGRLLVLDLDGVAAWVQPGTDGEQRSVASTRCRGPGRPSPDGSRLVCPGESATVVQPITWRSRALALEPSDAHFLGTDGELLIGGQDELRAVALADPTRTRVVAPHRPTADLLVAPNGERAIGRYERDGRAEVFAFRLDGTAARRKLGGDLHPRAWSPDSRWVLLGHERRACLARAVGGEYKCWERYTALAFSPDSRYVLLARRGALYVAPIEGVEPARPKRVAEAAGPATWIP